MNIILNMAIMAIKSKNGHFVIKKINGQDMDDGFELSGQRQIFRQP